MASSSAKVCVIGAGAAGLCAARRLAEAHLQPVVFEQTNVVGGIITNHYQGIVIAFLF